jgi:amino acid transporter
MGKSNEPSLSRDIGLAAAIAVGLGTMMGAGIFVLSADAAERAGPAATITYLIAGLIVLPIAMILSELVTAMPQEGGSYTMISRTIGPLAAAVVGPANWLGLAFATGFYLIGFAQYMEQVVDIPRWVYIIAMGALFIFINYRGAHLSGVIEEYFIAPLLLLLIGFIIWGGLNVQSALLRPFAPEGWGSVLGTIGLIIVSYTGFEKISTFAGEIQEPEKNVPRAIIASVLIATVIYVGILFAATGVMPYAELGVSATPLMDAAERFAGGAGAIAMLVAGVLATASSANAAVMASSRISYAMGRDRLIPSWFGHLHEEHRTPCNAIIATGALGTALGLTGATTILAEIGSALFMVSYALLATGLILMRRTKPDWYQPTFRSPLVPWLPILAGLASLSVILTMDRFSQLSGLALAALSLIWYFVWARKRTRVRGVVNLLESDDHDAEHSKPS